MAFSPFRDEHGSPKDLVDVTWDDLSQLADLDEGYVLEFKQTFGTTVRRKVPKTIASFSNSSGGWLIIGIADADRSICPIKRDTFDFSQAIGELCRRHVTPTPRLDMRFVIKPGTTDEGVLVVKVEEGDFPPYVADGVVEVREGSTSGPAVGSALVELYGKATRRRAEANAHAAAMRAAFARQSMECHTQHAHDSLIFRTSVPLGSADPHSAIELFSDESMKLTVPAVLLEGEERERALGCLERIAGGRELPGSDDATLMSAPETLARVTRMASVLDRYVRLRAGSWQDFAVAYELEGMAGAMLWSDDATYLDYVRRRGILFCGTTDCRSTVRYLDDGDHDSFRARQFAGSHFFEACGLPLGSPDPDDNALVDTLLKTSG